MILTVTCLATNIPLDIELDLVEQAWATDNNPKTINESWYKLCESVNQRPVSYTHLTLPTIE